MDNLQDFFLIILNMSITVAYIAIAIIVIRVLFLKKAPKLFSYSLWGILLIKLISPVSFSSAFSFFRLFKVNVNRGTGIIEHVPQVMQSQNVGIGMDKINHTVNTSLMKTAETASANPTETFITIASIVWVLGIVGLIIYSIFSYYKILSKVNTATLFQNNVIEETKNRLRLRRKIKVYTSDQINSPFVCGLIVPKVYLPVNIPEKELSYILTHELVHVKRLDYLVKPFSYLLLVLHWFNPLLWISFRLMTKDMEMSCDEKVMKVFGGEIKRDYSNLLLSLSVNESNLLQVGPLAFGESNTKSRIKNVLRFKKTSYILTVIIVILIGIVGYTLLSNPNSLDISKSFEPKSIEIDIGDGMKEIKLIDEQSQHISELLQYDTWEKAKMEYDLSTTTYISNEDKKVIGLFENVDGYTFINLYNGFSTYNGDFYKAPREVYENIEKYLAEYYLENDNTHNSDNEFKEFKYNQVRELANQYGYENGVILGKSKSEVKLLLNNRNINKEDDLKALIISLDSKHKVVKEEEFFLPEELKNYSLDFIFGDSSEVKHLVGYRSVIDIDNNKINSDLLVFDKGNLSEMRILQSYSLSTGAQGTIPTVIDFSLELLGDYIVYQDVDLYYKVQDVRSGEVFKSEENNPYLDEATPMYKMSGEYLYILKYAKDNSILVFDTNNKKFEVIESQYNDVLDSELWQKIVDKNWSNFDNWAGEGIYFYEKNGRPISAFMIYGSGVPIVHLHESEVKFKNDYIIIEIPETSDKNEAKKIIESNFKYRDGELINGDKIYVSNNIGYTLDAIEEYKKFRE